MKADLEKARGVIERIIVPLGYELIDLRYLSETGGWVLRAYVDRTGGGMTVGDCQTVSREIETVLEIEEVVPERYSLEVTTPGLNRPLVQEADFSRFAGNMVNIKTRQPIDGRRNFKGKLVGIESGVIKVVIDHQEFQVPYREVEKANLVF